MNRLRILDGWRGLAIIAVQIGHFTPIPFLNAGRLGVELFFVLSGRPMGGILFVKKEKLLRFYWRRFTRIVPAMYVFLVICYFLTQYIPPIRLTTEAAISSATFTYNYLHGRGYGAAVVDHIWSLCVEEHTYIVLGLLAYMSLRLRIRPWRVCFALAALCMLNGFYMTYAEGLSYYDVYWRTDTRATGILLGCGVCCCSIDRPEWFSWITGNVVVLLFVMALASSLYPIPDPVKYSIGTTALALVLVFLDRLALPLKLFLGHKTIAFFVWLHFRYTCISSHSFNTLALAEGFQCC